MAPTHPLATVKGRSTYPTRASRRPTCQHSHTAEQPGTPTRSSLQNVRRYPSGPAGWKGLSVLSRTTSRLS